MTEQIPPIKAVASPISIANLAVSKIQNLNTLKRARERTRPSFTSFDAVVLS